MLRKARVDADEVRSRADKTRRSEWQKPTLPASRPGANSSGLRSRRSPSGRTRNVPPTGLGAARLSVLAPRRTSSCRKRSANWLAPVQDARDAEARAIAARAAEAEALERLWRCRRRPSASRGTPLG